MTRRLALTQRLDWLRRPQIVPGNRVRLLVNGEQFFPMLLAAIDDAVQSVHLETYIFADDNIGKRFVDALAAAAGRGVQVRLIVDGFGGGEFARTLVSTLGAHGAEVKIFRPERWWRLERKLLRRLHRKIAVIDERLAFIGGINIIDDHHHPDGERGLLGPRFDFAVACEGPIVGAVTLTARRLWWTLTVAALNRPETPLPTQRTLAPLRPLPAGVPAQLLLRDNLRNRRSIENAYLDAFARARREITIANAYFLPGRRFRTALCEAAQRGVKVRLLLQGRIEYLLQYYAQQALYGQLLRAGIEIYEYRPSYLHAKAAVIDDGWATVGSSNIDPYSLLLAREANVVVYDRAFAAELRGVIDDAITRDARAVQRVGALTSWPTRLLHWIAFGVVRLAVSIVARGRGG